MKKVLALATCFNRKEKTIKTINSLISGNKDISFSFIICDDNSSDGTYDELVKIKEVEVIKGTGSLYWCGGMRKTVTKALELTNGYDYCMFFNDDVNFFENSIEKLANKEKNVVWVGPTCDKNGNMTYGGIVKTSNWRPKYITIKGENDNGSICDTFNANCVLIPWKIFKKYGNFDDVYTHGMGDFDYGFRLSRKNEIVKVSNEFIGICNQNDPRGTFNDRELSIKKRLELKRDPKRGLPANEWFHYLNKNYNLLTALVYSISPYIKIFLNI